MKLAVLPLARPTFDVVFAQETLDAMLARLRVYAAERGHKILGPSGLVMAADEAALPPADADILVILQVTFTDAAFGLRAAAAFGGRVAVWASSEPRAGGRLRLNGFCGLNLLSHALGRNDIAFAWGYGLDADLQDLIEGGLPAVRRGVRGQVAPVPVRPLRIGRIGEPPDGFDTCDYDAQTLRDLTGTEVEELTLKTLFDRARAALPAAVAPYLAKAQALDRVERLDAGEVDRSMRLAAALEELRSERSLDALAIRCWPETFTEYGGAVCGPASMLGESGVPCACEADVYGAVTQAILQDVADAPVFLADIVDMDETTGVVWHCGQAPASMAGSELAATVHTNRKQALLYEFVLRPGRVTLFRLSQARGEAQIVIATGEMIAAPMAFTGTSGTVRWDRPGLAVRADLIGSGLEHHMALAYGDHADALRGVAAGLDLPVLELGA